MMTIDDNNNNNIVNGKVSCTQYLPLLWVSELRIESNRRAQRAYYDTKMQQQWTMIEMKMEKKNEIKREPESMYLYCNC